MGKITLTSFIALAEGIAGLWALLPFIVLIIQQQSDPTNPKYIEDLANLLPRFIEGQILGLISSIVHAILGKKS